MILENIIEKVIKQGFQRRLVKVYEMILRIATERGLKKYLKNFEKFDP